MAQCDPDSMGDTGVPSSSHEQTALTLQRTKWTTAGQGGTIMQLERVGDILAQPQQMPRQQVVLLDDAPQNVLAPTSRHQRVTQASQKRKTRTMENHTEDLAIEMNLDSGPLPEFQKAESGSRFGFQAQTPRQPSFVGMQSLNKFCLQPLSMVPEVPSTSSTPDPFVSWAVSTTVSGSLKGTTEKSYFKPSQTKHNDLSEPRSGEESCDSNDGPWSSLDDAGDVQDAEDEASCGCAGSNDVPDSDHMSENAGPHELDDELGQGGQTPLPQVHSQQSSSQQ
ncbi:hypothetical protein BKA83DRAFT_4497936 [Pisolithus microcarpus]|nr:hypothetical protein BKA83DRAFT_4497936 [Pisolithus microcarpus]